MQQTLNLQQVAKNAVRKAVQPKLVGYPQSDWFATPLAREKQLPPPGDWRIWLILAGRGFGKTRTAVEWGIEQARLMPGSIGVMVGSTESDVYKVLITGESGIHKSGHEDFRPTYNRGLNLLTFPNGSSAWMLSANKPDRLRGLNTYWAVCDELAAWQYPDAFDQLLLGLRLGDDPRVVIATTPRPTPIIKRLLKDPTVTLTGGSTYENKDNVAPAFLDAIIRRYEGTRLGRQELNAEVLDDVPGALWTRALLETHRVMKAPELTRIAIGIDPSASSNDESDETGIIAAGIGVDGHGYILEDASLVAEAEQRAKAAVTLYHKYSANTIVAEVNNGGDWIPFAIRVVDQDVPVKVVHASRGKFTRAEPIAGLYEQGKVHHVGYHGALEDQLCSWTTQSPNSPDRLDALVWVLWDLLLKPRSLGIG